MFKRSARMTRAGMPASYPGSPAIAQALLRPQDRIALCEAHPEEKEKLVAALGRDPRLSIVGTDGYVALNAYCPPKERRGLVLIDPSFEEPDELKHVEEALARGDPQMAGRNLCRLAADPRGENRRALSQRGRRARRAQHSAGSNSTSAPGEAGAHGQEPLARAGLLVVNPPHTLFAEARVLLPWLAALLARSGQGGHVCKWLTEPR